MDFRFNKAKIEELMQSFYTLTGIRFVLFDAEFNEIAFYPQEKCDFCRLMNSAPKTRAKCLRSDRCAFLRCSAEDTPIIYTCHAGLIEAVIPLHENEKIIGYLMFGQITNNPDKSALYDRLDFWQTNCGLAPALLREGIADISCKTDKEIDAAANIMEACTSYIIYKELITPENSKLIHAAKTYIEEHLSEDIQIETLCAELQIGRTKLYKLFKEELDTGVSKYILKRRMHRAKKLLKTTALSVTEISQSVGFSDYNYFRRVFKSIYGCSPKSCRR